MTLPCRRYILLVVVTALFATTYFVRSFWLPAAAFWLDVGEAPVKVDYAFVAAGDAETRAFTAALLFRHGYVGKVLLTRPPRHVGSTRESKEFDELAREILLHEGVPADRIEVVPGDVYSTMDEAELLATRIRAEPNATFVLVTTNYHTRRTRWAFERVAPETRNRLHVFSAPMDGFDATNWWRTENGPATYVSEYLRLGFYHLRYGAAGYLLAGAAIAWSAWRIGRRYLRRDFFVRRGGGAGRNSSTKAT